MGWMDEITAWLILKTVMYGMWAIGKIVWFRTSTSGLYDGLRYPLRVQWPWGIYEQSVFISHYEDVPKFKDNPQQLLEIYKDDLALKLIPDIENPKEVMRAQSELSEKKNIYDLIEFLDTYETPVWDKVDYIYKYALASLEKAWDKELKLISKAYDFIESKDFYSIQKTEIKSFMLSKFKNKIESKWTTVNDLVSIYTYIREPFYKVIVKVAIIDRARDMDDTELYNTATAFKGTDIEWDILALLEAKIS